VTQGEAEELKGAALDAAVAERVMGWKHLWSEGRVYWQDPQSRPWEKPHCFSTDVAAAWQVVTRLTTMGYRVRVTCYDDKCAVGIHPRYDETTLCAEAFGYSAADVICRAALRLEQVPRPPAVGDGGEETS
jgi:hypothetical protein